MAQATASSTTAGAAVRLRRRTSPHRAQPTPCDNRVTWQVWFMQDMLTLNNQPMTTDDIPDEQSGRFCRRDTMTGQSMRAPRSETAQDNSLG